MPCSCGSHALDLLCAETLTQRCARSGHDAGLTLYTEAVRQQARWYCSLDPYPPKGEPWDSIIVAVQEIVNGRNALERAGVFGHTAEDLGVIAREAAARRRDMIDAGSPELAQHEDIRCG